MRGAALFSRCGRFRYTLVRAFDLRKPMIVFVLLNPSKATATTDDPTTRRGIGYARRWGFGIYVAVNCYALISTDPRALRTHPNPDGPANLAHVHRLVSLADQVVVAWGNGGAGSMVARWMRKECLRPLLCFGTNGTGEPTFPLYQRNDATLVRWPG